MEVQKKHKPRIASSPYLKSQLALQFHLQSWWLHRGEKINSFVRIGSYKDLIYPSYLFIQIKHAAYQLSLGVIQVTECILRLIRFFSIFLTFNDKELLVKMIFIHIKKRMWQKIQGYRAVRNYKLYSRI